MRINLPFSIVFSLLISSCTAGVKPTTELPRMTDRPKAGTEFVAKAKDFDCILRTAEKGHPPETSWHHVRNFYLKNTMGRTQEALDVANGVKPGPYPVGTIIQLVYMEAMVKRGGTQHAATSGWEFFALGFDDKNATVIRSRGADETINFAGLNCFECHKKAKPEFDLVCEDTHGCDPLGIGKTAIGFMQSGDPRCR